MIKLLRNVALLLAAVSFLGAEPSSARSLDECIEVLSYAACDGGPATVCPPDPEQGQECEAYFCIPITEGSGTICPD